MTLLSRMSALMLAAAPALVSASFAQAVDVWTVGVNNTRQGWNKFETVLTPANVPNLRKTREFMVDEKIDVSPLVVGNKLYVFTMTNTAYVFDVGTGAQLAKR
jgi:glucose dehydrogenase